MSTDSKPALVKVVSRTEFHAAIGGPVENQLSVYGLDVNAQLRELKVTTVSEPGPDDLVLIAGCVLSYMEKNKVLTAKVKTPDGVEHDLILNNMYCSGETLGDTSTFEEAALAGYDVLVGSSTGTKLIDESPELVANVVDGSVVAEHEGKLMFMFLADGTSEHDTNQAQPHAQSWMDIAEYRENRTQYHPLEEVAAMLLLHIADQRSVEKAPEPQVPLTAEKEEIAKFSADLADILCDEEYFYSKEGVAFMAKHDISRYFKDHIKTSTKATSRPVDLVSSRIDHVLLYEDRVGKGRDWVSVPVNRVIPRERFDQLVCDLAPHLCGVVTEVYVEVSKILHDAGFSMLK